MVHEPKRRYRKVLTRMWGDDRFRELSKPQPNAQSLWQYLITGPHTTSVPGLFSIGEAALAEALGWPLKGLRKAWDEIASRKMALADWQARVVYLPKAIEHNTPENPNVVKGWRSTIDDLPECALKSKALAEIQTFLIGRGFTKGLPVTLSASPLKPLASTSGNGMANQEQEQEQEQEYVQEQEQEAAPPPSRERVSSQATGHARSKRPIFSGQRVVVFEWMLDDLRRLLGSENFEAFGMDAWIDELDRHAVSTAVVIPQRDGGQWLLAETLREAQRRGLLIAVATPVAKAGKLTTRLAAALDSISREEEARR